MEERTIKISREKAKEWFSKGGELKEIALQAYKEEELQQNVPMSWDEYAKLGSLGHWFAFTNEAEINTVPCATCNLFATREEARAFSALGKLIQLRDAWWASYNEGKGWKPNPLDHTTKYTIVCCEGKPSLSDTEYFNKILMFPNAPMRSTFFTTFKELINEAKMFL